MKNSFGFFYHFKVVSEPVMDNSTLLGSDASNKLCPVSTHRLTKNDPRFKGQLTSSKRLAKGSVSFVNLNEIADKELRKKLRNRQSALAARERKKARMLQLENQVSELQTNYRRIEDENQFLRARLENVKKQCEQLGVHITGLDRNQHPSTMFPIIDFNNPQFLSKNKKTDEVESPRKIDMRSVKKERSVQVDTKQLFSNFWSSEKSTDVENVQAKVSNPFLNNTTTYLLNQLSPATSDSQDNQFQNQKTFEGLKITKHNSLPSIDVVLQSPTIKKRRLSDLSSDKKFDCLISDPSDFKSLWMLENDCENKTNSNLANRRPIAPQPTLNRSCDNILKPNLFPSFLNDISDDFFNENDLFDGINSPSSSYENAGNTFERQISLISEDISSSNVMLPDLLSSTSPTLSTFDNLSNDSGNSSLDWMTFDEFQDEKI